MLGEEKREMVVGGMEGGVNLEELRRVCGGGEVLGH